MIEGGSFMIYSMTAFASKEQVISWGTLSCELRSVNHRFQDVSVRLSDELRQFEPLIRKRICANLQRGKIELTLRWHAKSMGQIPTVNMPMLERLKQIATQLSAHLPQLQVELSRLIQLPGVIEEVQLNLDDLQPPALALVDEVLRQLRAVRRQEGAALATGIAERGRAMATIADRLGQMIPTIRQGQRARLLSRFEQLPQSMDIGRFDQELVLWLQKMDIDEELDRFYSHLDQLNSILNQGGVIGKRLDFLMQELQREANTMSAKSVDSTMSVACIDLKVLIDQIREQVQNIE